MIKVEIYKSFGGDPIRAKKYLNNKDGLLLANLWANSELKKIHNGEITYGGEMADELLGILKTPMIFDNQHNMKCFARISNDE